MSAATLELGRRVLDTLSRRDFDELVELSDPEVEWHSFFAELGPSGVYRGFDGMRQYAADIGEAFELVEAQIDDGLAVGDTAVFVGRIRYRGRTSGFETAAPTGWMLRFRDGKVLRFRAFRDPEGALESVRAP